MKQHLSILALGTALAACASSTVDAPTGQSESAVSTSELAGKTFYADPPNEELEFFADGTYRYFHGETAAGNTERGTWSAGWFRSVTLYVADIPHNPGETRTLSVGWHECANGTWLRTVTDGPRVLVPLCQREPND